MRRKFYFLSLALTTFISTFAIPSGNAVKLRDGKTYFNQVPQLVDAYSTQKTVNSSSAIYYFKINVPKDAGEALQKVEIKQFQAIDEISIDVSESQSGVAIAVAPDKTVSVVFNPPIPAGESIDIRLQPMRNPRFGGVYLFGVTAFPQGEDPYGQFLGYGRLNFYDSGSYSH